MANLINTDSAGNVFYNYITPVIKGESASSTSQLLESLFATKLGTKNTTWTSNGSAYTIRLPAPGLEMKTGAVSSTQNGWSRFYWEVDNFRLWGNSSSTNTSVFNIFGTTTSSPFPSGTPFNAFAVVNDYAVVYARFNETLTSLQDFAYMGWLREPVYTGDTTGVLGIVVIRSVSTTTVAYRPLSAGSTTNVNLSTAADTITSPPIVCTTGTDPGDGSETFTDIVIRDAASPNNPVGKLWNCIDLPATATVGGLYKNVGAYDGDNSASEQDIYLCVMPWGERKLGMRVWTENV